MFPSCSPEFVPGRPTCPKRIGTIAIKGLVENLKVDRERALAELNADWTCTQEIADGLVRNANVDFRTGHGFASALVTWARTNGKTPA